ncbi:MAG: transposase [Polaribacter sp.]|jgi:transposase
MVTVPDEIEIHKVDWCSNCYKSISNQKADGVQRRQVFDLSPIKVLVTEHQVEIKICKCGCVNRGVFPNSVNHYVQYGPRLRGITSYLQSYQLLPCFRTKELIKDLFGHDLSTGTLQNIQSEAYTRLESFETDLKKLLIFSPVAVFDETGFYVNGKRFWLHSTSTESAVYYGVHQIRGPKAMDSFGILPEFKGIAIHDFWKSYFKYSCTHGLCNAHSLRDLIFIKERFKQAWPNDMIDLLLKMKVAKEKAILKGKSALSKATLNNYRKQYNKIIKAGLSLNPFKPPVEKKERPRC